VCGLRWGCVWGVFWGAREGFDCVRVPVRVRFGWVLALFRLYSGFFISCKARYARWWWVL